MSYLLLWNLIYNLSKIFLIICERIFLQEYFVLLNKCPIGSFCFLHIIVGLHSPHIKQIRQFLGRQDWRPRVEIVWCGLNWWAGSRWRLWWQFLLQEIFVGHNFWEKFYVAANEKEKKYIKNMLQFWKCENSYVLIKKVLDKFMDGLCEGFWSRRL